MGKFEKEKKFPGYVIAVFYVLAGILICSVMFLAGSSLEKNPLAAGSIFPASASPKEKEETFPTAENTEDKGDAREETEEPPSPEPDSPEPVCYSFVTINVKDALNVRTQPGMDAEIIHRLPPGATGYVLERGPEWSLIQTSDITGYAYNRYLEFQEIPEEAYLPEAEGTSQ